MHNKYVSTTNGISAMNAEIQSFRKDFRKEEEYMRVARKVTDNLQEEYCKVVNAVASEKQRNLMYIEKAKREFIAELIAVNMKIADFAGVTKRVKAIEDKLEARESLLH